MESNCKIDSLKKIKVERSTQIWLQIATRREVPAEKKPPGEVAIERLKIATNILGVKLEPISVYLYDVEVIGFTSKGHRVELAKQSRDESGFCF